MNQPFEDYRVDLGAVQIHKKVIGDIAIAAVKDLDGVRVTTYGLLNNIFDLFGYKNYPSVVVDIDKDGQVTIEVKVNVRYGMNVPDVARSVQDAVQVAVERSTNITLKEVNVNIQGIERGA